MKNYKWFVLLAVCMWLLAACSSSTDEKTDLSEWDDYVVPKYARLFSSKKNGNNVYVEVYDPNNTDIILKKYLITPNGIQRKNSSYIDIISVAFPLQHVGCAHSTQIGFLNKLNKLENISCIGNRSFLEKKSALSKNDTIPEFFNGWQFDIEKLLKLSPQAVFFTPGGGENADAAESTGIPFIYDMSPWENHPLARTEWIKFIALFMGESERANSLFEAVESRYLALTELTKASQMHPTLIAGMPYQQVWHVPAGASFKAILFRDAGFDYIWKENENTGSLPLDFETVLYQGGYADFWCFEGWLDPGYTRQNMLEQNKSYGDFNAWKQGRVLACNTLVEPFFEQGIVEPDVLLSDLIYFSCPGLLEGYIPKYYRLIP